MLHLLKKREDTAEDLSCTTFDTFQMEKKKDTIQALACWSVLSTGM